MNNISVPVEYRSLDALLSFMDGTLLNWGCPTVLRLRCLMVTEELFDAAYIVPGDEKQLSCTAGSEPGTFRISLYAGGEPAVYSHSDVSALMTQPCTSGLLLRWENEFTAFLKVARQA